MVESSTVEGAGISLGRCVFCSRALDCVATIQGWPLFAGGHYSRAASIWRNTVGSCTRSNELFLLIFFAPKYREFVV